MDYKQTLLMPRTDFEMRGNLPTKEPNILKQWEEDHFYEKLMAKHDGQPKFVLHDGPPYANGNLHAGTAMNRIIKDIINYGCLSLKSSYHIESYVSRRCSTSGFKGLCFG